MSCQASCIDADGNFTRYSSYLNTISFSSKSVKDESAFYGGGVRNRALRPENRTQRHAGNDCRGRQKKEVRYLKTKKTAFVYSVTI